ncbi:MAG: FixH family protein [Kibdelosporangium sp.]
MTRARWAALAPLTAVLVAVVTGCGQSSAGSEDTTSCTDTKTESGMTIALTTSPCPIRGGKSANARVTVKDTAGAVVKDAAVKVVTDMPSMNMHGGDQAAAPNGDGYETKLVLGMGGDWDVKVEVSRGSSPPAAVIFQINAK